MIRRRAILATLLLGLLGLALPASADWPRFRGPDGSGHADGPLPSTWSATEGVVWKTPLPGQGWSSPVVLNEQVWATTALEEERSLRALAVEVETGALVHDVEVFRPAAWGETHPTNGYASPTPVLEDDRVWVHFGGYGTAALSTTTGEVLWRNEEIRPNFEVGPGSSPIVWEDLLLVPFDGTDLQEIAAFDKVTGALRWRTPRGLPDHIKPPHRKSFSTPLVLATAKRRELIVPGAQQVVAYDPRTGRPWWTVRYEGYSVVPSPIAGLERVFLTTGYMQARLLAIRPGGLGDVTETHVDWDFRWQVPRNATPVLLEDRIFLVSDHGRASWIDARQGTDVWAKRLGGSYSASPITADGRLYVTSDEGRTLVLEPDDTGPHQIAANDLGAPVFATPAASRGQIYLRTAHHLFRIGSTIEDP